MRCAAVVSPQLSAELEQLALLCAENREAVLELAAYGQVLAMTPAGSETGARNCRIEMRLLLWADRQVDGRFSAAPVVSFYLTARC